MKTWQSTQTRGFIKAVFLILMTSVTIMGSSIASQIQPLEKSTLEESTSCKSENPKEEKEELQASQTGNDILEALTNLNKILEQWEKRISEEKSSRSIQQSEKQTTQRQDNSF